jgi:hypothetical protein
MIPISSGGGLLRAQGRRLAVRLSDTAMPAKALFQEPKGYSENRRTEGTAAKSRFRGDSCRSPRGSAFCTWTPLLTVVSRIR